MPQKNSSYIIKKSLDNCRDNNLGQSRLFQKKKNFTKIVAFILISILIIACNSEKRVPARKQLLVKNEIVQNNKSIKNQNIYDQLYQQPNSSIVGYRMLLNLYNLANPNPDSTFNLKYHNKEKKYNREVKWLSEKQIARLRKSFWYHGIHTFLKETGEAPVIADTLKSKKSLLRLKSHYFNNGYFNVKATYKLDSLSPKKAKMKYDVTTGNPFFLDTITTTILTPVLDSLYKTKKSLIIAGNQYKTEDFENEKDRISTLFRNNGAYRFQPNYVTFDIDTINKKDKANINLSIGNYLYQENDSTKTEPFKIYKISDINIYTDYKSTNHNSKIKDSLTYNNMNLYGFEKIKYTPHAITDAVFIVKGGLFADNKTVLSTRYLNNLKIFNYPTIQYEVDKRDSTSQSLIAKIYLTPRKKFSFGYTLDLTHSNIEDFGIAASITETVRNVFNGAETLELSARGNIGASNDIADPGDSFFNVSEYGADAKLNFPRILFPFKTEKIIPKSMIPSTIMSVGFSKQTNIGLDKENFSGVYSYSWTPKKNNTTRFDLFNIQFVNNLNPENYYNVYGSSYDALNKIAKDPSVVTDPTYFDTKTGDLIIESGTTGFTNAVLSDKTSLKPNDQEYKDVSSIEQQRIRLTDNDFIMATNIVFTKTTKKDLQDNNFYMFRTKIESAGTLLSAISSIGNLPKNSNGNYEIFNLEYAEYLKTEFDFVKYWDIDKGKVFAMRTFFGIAIPYGNSNFIPFTKSYYAGGSNDNRAWQPYRLGPGSSPSTNNFNEANLKIAISGEYRFLIGGKFNGALFADAGNIWNVFDETTFEPAQFNSIKDLSKIALGTGFGLRYDFGFFVVRVDIGLKTYNPALEMGDRWFTQYNFANSVFNFGINYPF
ncbi:BamA/TamA family outer membrane protein [Flavobacterium sp. ZT3R18]|uniref:translocation and assembly module lipoprotein TamL n=1 Tax=Flavobacterium sp. ZT3R18 TaxID=2594429 RepID=UPI00117B5641|nr:BamA/TamA family outer membrane protein [Flavobacterium sp. ZT3R18]TRX35310.1 BamA/TamA family outer membrane protein [Flavobacterium sp. ZT3R18]